MTLTLHAQPGCPFVVELTHEYQLTKQGLTVTHTMRNPSQTAVPYGVGMHPYFTVGTPFIDPCFLSLPANDYFITNARSIPVGSPVSVAGTPFDFRVPREIGDTVFDTGFTGLVRQPDGFAYVALGSPSGRGITVWLDANHQYVWIYSGDTLPDPARGRRSLAIEPYTCASDAFNNGFGLRIIQPGQSFSASWGVIPPRG